MYIPIFIAIDMLMFIVFAFFVAAEDCSQGTWSDLERHRRQHFTAIWRAGSEPDRKAAIAERDGWLRRQCWSLFQSSCLEAVFYAAWCHFGPNPEPEPESEAEEDGEAEPAEPEWAQGW